MPVTSPRFRSATVVGALAVVGCIHDPGAAVGGNLIPSSEVRPLRQVGATAGRRIGTAVMSHRLADSQVRTLVAREFDSLTPENEMKWEWIEPRPGAFEFAGGDRLVAFAAENGIRMRGHTLVWHEQLPFWVKGLGADALRAAMARHIQNVVGHWKGRIAQWDVVNEALANGDSGQLRGDSPFVALGPTFIDEAFRIAHAADPQAQLFYNDYEIEAVGAPKSEAAYALCKRLKEGGVPIHGVGFQMHVDPRRWPNAEAIRQNIARYAALGLAVELTEMDVPVGALPGDITHKLQAQRQITHDIVAACVAVDGCSGITFWGASDRDSWLNSARWGRLRGRGPHYPLPFNANLEPKPMVAGIIDALEKR
jgi:endo-1,4-beta-xylanase